MLQIYHKATVFKWKIKTKHDKKWQLNYKNINYLAFLKETLIHIQLLSQIIMIKKYVMMQ